MADQHQFVHTHFSKPTWCAHCTKFLWGVGKQGYKCSKCKYPAHDDCFEEVKSKCTGFHQTSWIPSVLDPAYTDQKVQQQEAVVQVAAVEYVNGHEFRVKDFMKPLPCSICSKFIAGSDKKQGLKCKKCSMLSHKQCFKNAPQCSGHKETFKAEARKSVNLSAEYENRERAGTWRNAKPKHLNPTLQTGHEFELIHFSNPTFCTFCTQFIWGIGKQGHRCKLCDYPAHTYCFEKVTSQCTKTKPDKNEVKKEVAERPKVRLDQSDVIEHEVAPIKDINIEDVYLFKRELGKGAFGVVKLAVHNQSNVRRAVKIIDKDNIPAKQKAMLDQEIEVMKRLRHPNIAELVEVYDTQKFLYLVMELANGGELFDHLPEHGFPEDEAAAIMQDITRAIHYLHSIGIVHRDLKLENALFASRQKPSPVKLVDFGLSARIGPDQVLQTQAGSPDYCAPEILMGESYGEAVDIWSLGVIMYILLSGTPPFFHPQGSKMIEKILQGKYSFPEKSWSKVSQEAKDLISHLLVVDPTKRYNASEILKHAWITKNTHQKFNLKEHLRTRRNTQLTLDVGHLGLGYDMLSGTLKKKAVAVIDKNYYSGRGTSEHFYTFESEEDFFKEWGSKIGIKESRVTKGSLTLGVQNHHEEVKGPFQSRIERSPKVQHLLFQQVEEVYRVRMVDYELETHCTSSCAEDAPESLEDLLREGASVPKPEPMRMDSGNNNNTAPPSTTANPAPVNTTPQSTTVNTPPPSTTTPQNPTVNAPPAVTSSGTNSPPRKDSIGGTSTPPRKFSFGGGNSPPRKESDPWSYGIVLPPRKTSGADLNQPRKNSDENRPRANSTADETTRPRGSSTEKPPVPERPRGMSTEKLVVDETRPRGMSTEKPPVPERPRGLSTEKLPIPDPRSRSNSAVDLTRPRGLSTEKLTEGAHILHRKNSGAEILSDPIQSKNFKCLFDGSKEYQMINAPFSSKTKDIYFRFFEKYGTHFIREVYFGNLIELYWGVERSSKQKVNEAAKKGFMDYALKGKMNRFAEVTGQTIPKEFSHSVVSQQKFELPKGYNIVNLTTAQIGFGVEEIAVLFPAHLRIQVRKAAVIYLKERSLKPVMELAPFTIVVIQCLDNGKFLRIHDDGRVFADSDTHTDVRCHLAVEPNIKQNRVSFRALSFNNELLGKQLGLVSGLGLYKFATEATDFQVDGEFIIKTKLIGGNPWLLMHKENSEIFCEGTREKRSRFNIIPLMNLES